MITSGEPTLTDLNWDVGAPGETPPASLSSAVLITIS